MPINTVKCPHCAARVNHIVKADPMAPGGVKIVNETMTCPRCKKPFAISSEVLSRRTLADAQELVDFEQRMSLTDQEFAKALGDSGRDSVEEALDRADQVFGAAKRALDDITLDDVTHTIDADQLLQQYAVPEVKQFAMGKVEQAARRAQGRFKLSDDTVASAMDMADRGVDAAMRKINDTLDEKLRSKLG